MIKQIAWKRFTSKILVTIVTSAVYFLASDCNADDFTESKDQSNATVVGVKECAACHSNPSPVYQALGVTQFVRLSEAKEWLYQDKHRHSYDLVRINGISKTDMEKPERQANKRSLQILQNLKWNVSIDQTTNQWKVDDPRFAEQCLTCHVGVDHRQPILDERILQFGVQCESCHGPGSEYVKTPNHQQSDWRLKSPEEKASLGMWNVRSAVDASKVCYSCHLGDVEQNRFVTHQFYAAGHPPLPPVEIQTYLNAMPPHWRTIQEKPYPEVWQEKDSSKIALIPDANKSFEFEENYLKTNFGDDSVDENYADLKARIQKDFTKTRRSVVGASIASDMGLKLVHQLAKDEGKWGDYAAFDCAGCHQELRKPSTRVVSLGRIPGRPYPARWWVSDLNRSSEEISNNVISGELFLATFDKVPFGDRQAILSLKDQFQSELSTRHEALRRNERKPMTERDVKDWILFLLERRKEHLYDYWTARQTGWLVEIALNELVEKQAIPEAAVAEIISGLNRKLQLNIRELKPHSSVLVRLESTLNHARDFRREEVEPIFEQVIALLRKQ